LQASEAFYPTMDDLKEVIKRRGPDHVGIEKVQLKVFNEHEPACREEQTLIREEKPHLLEEVSYKSFPMEKLEIFMQETDGSEIQTVYTEKIKKESNCQEHINNCLDCSGNTLQALKNCIVANFVEEVNGQSLDGFQENTFAEMLFLSATLQLRGVHPLFQPLRDSWTNVLVYNGALFLFHSILCSFLQCNVLFCMANSFQFSFSEIWTSHINNKSYCSTPPF
jgi:hypothetical protein